MSIQTISFKLYFRVKRLLLLSPGIKANRLLVFVVTFLLSLYGISAQAQVKRVVAIGSSTTAGIGASTKDSGWVSRLNKYYGCRLGITDTIVNLGVPASDNYRAMPTSYTPPAARPFPDNGHNITKARLLLQNITNPANGVVIVNFPSNGYNGYGIAEVLSSLQVIYDSATSAGNRCFITTTQPRTDADFNTPAVKRKLADLKDSIINRFGIDNTLNFWDGMFNPADSSILEKYSAGDLIHFNNAGHREVFNRVIAKNILNLPVWYSKASGNLNELSTWGSNPDGSGDSPTSFTADYQLFKVVNNPAPTISANWIINGNTSRLVIGDGINPVNLVIPEGLKISITNPPINTCY